MEVAPSFPLAWDYARELARGFGRALGPGDETRLEAFGNLLLQWNARMNLTGARDLSTLVDEHFPDALALAALVPRGASVLDVGTGGGLPALPFALLRPDCPLVMVEPRAKRVMFLRTALRALALDPKAVRVVEGRLPDKPSFATALALGGPFQVAWARATFPPARWLELGRRTLAAGEVLLFLSQETLAETPLRETNYTLRNGHRRRVATYSSVNTGT